MVPNSRSSLIVWWGPWQLGILAEQVDGVDFTAWREMEGRREREGRRHLTLEDPVVNES